MTLIPIYLGNHLCHKTHDLPEKKALQPIFVQDIKTF